MIRTIQTTFRGKHTMNDYSNFFIKHKNINSAFTNIILTCRNILVSNNIRIVDEVSSILPINGFNTPDGFTMAFLLDESHLSLHSYTNSDLVRGDIIGKLALDLFTCSPNPLNHYNTVRDLNKFIIENYDAVLDNSQTINRF